MKSFSPHTRQNDEREIIRVQSDFSAGAFIDSPIPVIPENGVAYLKNFKNFGNRLEGRHGSRVWGDYRNNIESNIPTNGTINAIYFSRRYKKIIILIDSLLYISTDYTATDWSPCYNESVESPDNSDSIFDEVSNEIILFNKNGIYKINISDNSDYYFYYKINSLIPQDKITTLADSGNYKYRYLYSLSKLDGNLLPLDTEIEEYRYKDRRDVGITLKLESGTNKPINNIDYTTTESSFFVGDETTSVLYSPDYLYNTLSGFCTPIVSGNRERHWDCYSIYRTKDLGINGYDTVSGIGNNTENYTWISDVQISKPLYGKFYPSGFGTPITFELSSGITEDFDVEDTIYINNCSGTFVPFSIFSCDRTILPKKRYYLVSNGDENIPSNIDIPAYIGASGGGLITISGNNVYRYQPYVYSNFDFDTCVGDRLKLSDGNIVHIISSGMGGSGEHYGICAETYDYSSPISCCVGIVPRNITDRITDEQLSVNMSSYPCQQRFFENIPNSDIGCVFPGIIFFSLKDDNYIYYSQNPYGYEYMLGYYHPLYQMTRVKDGIRAIKKLPDNAVIYSKNSTTIIPLNITQPIELPELGISINVLAGQTEIDNNIGVMADKSIQYLENNSHIVITNEPAIRIFDGQKYSNNLSYPWISETLSSFGFNIHSSYNSIDGYTFWVNDSSINGNPNRCFNFGLGNIFEGNSQSIGFYEISGNIPIPNNNGIVNVLDYFDYGRTIVLDKDDDKFYDITTRKGPQGNAYEELNISFYDKKGIDQGSSGFNIYPEVQFKEDRGESENYILEHYYSKFYFSNNYFYKSILTNGVFNSPNINCEFTIVGFNGYSDLLNTSKYNKVYHFDGKTSFNEFIINKKLESKTLRSTLLFDYADITLYKREQRYIVKDIDYNAENSDIGEFNIQDRLSSPIFWLNANSNNNYIDKISGLTVSNVIDSGESYYDYINNTLKSYKTLTFNGNIYLPSTITSGNKDLLFIICNPDHNGISVPFPLYINNNPYVSGFYATSENGQDYLVWVSGINISGQVLISGDPYHSSRNLIDLRVYDFNLTQEEVDYYYDDFWNNNMLNITPMI